MPPALSATGPDLERPTIRPTHPPPGRPTDPPKISASPFNGQSNRMRPSGRLTCKCPTALQTYPHPNHLKMLQSEHLAIRPDNRLTDRPTRRPANRARPPKPSDCPTGRASGRPTGQPCAKAPRTSLGRPTTRLTGRPADNPTEVSEVEPMRPKEDSATRRNGARNLNP